MDTISLNVYGSKSDLEEIIKMIDDDNYSTDGIERTRSEVTRKKGYIVIKLSYPKYFAENNAYLISTKEEALIVQEELVEKIEGYGINVDRLEYKVNRIDIPFTYLMKEKEVFNNYVGVFRYMAVIRNSKGVKNIKAINEFLSGKVETIIYSSGNNSKASNSKLTIYNQYKRMVDTYYSVGNMSKEYPELKRRVRLEIMKRIRMKVEPLVDFKTDDLLGRYYKSYKKELLMYLDLERLDKVIESEAKKFYKMLQERPSKFRWETFIYKNSSTIHSYESIKRAIKYLDLKDKSKERAITIARKAILELDKIENTDRLDTYRKFKELKSEIESSSLLD